MNFTLTSALSTNQAAYPDRAERNPKKKTPEWVAQWGYAFAGDVLRRTDFHHWYHAASENEIRLSYLMGQQNAARYERFLEPATAATDPSGISQKIDRRILRVVPKHVRILSDKLAEQEFAPSVTVIDERGEQEKQQHLDKVQLWQEQGDWLRAAGVRPPDELPANMPQDADDLQLYANGEYQHDDAVAMEQKLSLCLEDANYQQLDRDIVLHFFTFGEAALYLGVGAGSRPLPTILLPQRCLFLPSAYEDYRDMRAGAHLDYLTLGQLRAEAGDQLKEEDYQRVAQAQPTQTQWDPLSRNLGTATDSNTVQVLRFSFLSEDDVVWKTKTDKLGNPVTSRKTADPNADFRGGDITRRTVLNVYEGVLILNTEFSYNCRLAVKQLRDSENPGRGMLPYAAFTPGMVAGLNSAAMDEVMPIADFCQEQWLRLQDACLRAVPQGFNFDPEVLLEGIAMLKGNKAKEGLDLASVMKMFYRTGNTVSKRKGRSGELLPPAITKNDTGLPTDVDRYWLGLRSGLQMLESIMSSNAVVSAATPNPEITKGQSDLAIAGTMSSLGYLAHGKEAMFALICRGMGIRIWLSERRQPVTGTLQPAPGKAPVRVGARPQLSSRRFSFRVERKPTAADRQAFGLVLQRSLDAKEITAADYAYLLEVDNLKEARRILAQRAKRNVAQAQALNQQNQQATIQGQVTAAQEAEKAKQATIRLQAQVDMEKEKVITARAIRVAEIYSDSQHQVEQERGDVALQKGQQDQAAGAAREALADHRAQGTAAQPQPFADLVPAGK